MAPSFPLFDLATAPQSTRIPTPCSRHPHAPAACSIITEGRVNGRIASVDSATRYFGPQKSAQQAMTSVASTRVEESPRAKPNAMESRGSGFDKSGSTVKGNNADPWCQVEQAATRIDACN